MKAHQKTYKRKNYSELQGWRSTKSKSELSSPINISEPYKVHSLAELHSPPRYPDFIAPSNYFPSISRPVNHSNRLKVSSPYQFDALPENFLSKISDYKRSKFSSTSTKACENDFPTLWTPQKSIDFQKEFNFFKGKSEESESLTETKKKEKIEDLVENFSGNGKKVNRVNDRHETRIQEIKKKKVLNERKENRSKSMFSQKNQRKSEEKSQTSVLMTQDCSDYPIKIPETKTFDKDLSDNEKFLLKNLIKLDESPLSISKKEKQLENPVVIEKTSEITKTKNDSKAISSPQRPKYQIIINPESSSENTETSVKIASSSFPRHEIPESPEIPEKCLKNQSPEVENLQNIPFTKFTPLRQSHSTSDNSKGIQTTPLQSFPSSNPSKKPSSHPVLPKSPLSNQIEEESSLPFHKSRNSLQKSPETHLSTIAEEPLAKSIFCREKPKKKAKTVIKKGQELFPKKKAENLKLSEFLAVSSNENQLKIVSRSGSSSKEASVSEEKEQNYLAKMGKNENNDFRRESLKPSFRKSRASVRVPRLRRTSTQMVKSSKRKSKLELLEIQRRNTLIVNDSEKEMFFFRKPKKSVERFINNFSIYMFGQLSVLLTSYNGDFNLVYQESPENSKILAQQRKTIKKNMIKEVKTAFKFLQKSKSLMTPEVIIQSITKGLFSQGIKNELISIIRTNKRQETLNSLKNYMVEIIKKRLNRKNIEEEASSSENSEKSSENIESSIEYDEKNLESLIKNFRKRSVMDMIESSYSSHGKQPLVAFSISNLDVGSEDSTENVVYLENDLEIDKELEEISTSYKPNHGFHFSSQLNRALIDKHNQDGLNPEWNQKIEEFADLENMKHLVLKQKFLEALKNGSGLDFFTFQRLLMLEADEKVQNFDHVEEIKRIRKMVKRKKYLKSRPSSFVVRRVTRTFSNLVKVFK